MKLTIKQTQCLDYLEDKETTEVLYGGAAGGGKSAVGAYFGLKTSLKYPGVRGLIGRKDKQRLKETTLTTFFDVCARQGVRPGVHYQYNDQKGRIKFMNGSTILLADLFTYPSDPEHDDLGSLELTWAFIDECNQITSKAKQVLLSRVGRYKNELYNLRSKLIMTCNPAKNWVYKDFYKPWKEKTISEDSKFIQALVTDNPHITPDYINNLRKMDPRSQARLLYGNWEYDDDPATMLDYDSIIAIFTNTFIKGTGKRYISADVARFGSDKTIIRVWDGLKVIRRIENAKQSTVTTAQVIRTLANAHQVPVHQIVIDEDGIGGGVVDMIPGCKGFVAQSSPISAAGKKENFTSLKAQCAFKLAEKVNANEIYEECNDSAVKERIVTELEQIKQKNMDRDGKLEIVSKEVIKQILGRSPDDSDTYIMRMYFEVRGPMGIKPLS
jgi:phage terminase large subunit